MATKPKRKAASKRAKPAPKKTKPTAKKAKRPAPAKSKRIAAPKKPKRPAPTRSRRIVPAAKTAAPKQLSGKEAIAALEKQILEDKKKLAALRLTLPPEVVRDYTFQAHDGSTITLAEMFGARQDLILVHNMGKSCAYCTMWADGFTGLVKHLENRAAFVVVSKDPVEVQREFYQSRGWNFRMYSSDGTTFNHDAGFESEDGHQYPGVSVFHKTDTGTIVRTGHTAFGPGDDFCAVWPMFDLLKDGPAGWSPKFAY